MMGWWWWMWQWAVDIAEGYVPLEFYGAEGLLDPSCWVCW